MTLAHRHRSTNKKIFKKHGKRLEIRKEQGNKSKIIASFPYNTNCKVSEKKWPFPIYANRVSRTRLNKSCCICDSRTKIEMHHVKHVRKQGYRYSGFQK
jgi:hypothetical protein